MIAARAVYIYRPLTELRAAFPGLKPFRADVTFVGLSLPCSVCVCVCGGGGGGVGGSGWAGVCRACASVCVCVWVCVGG